MQREVPQAVLDDLFAQSDFDRRLYTLRLAYPHLAYELDELARMFRRARDRVAGALLGDPAAASV